MKILALGGCGDMGKVAVREIIGQPKVSEVVIADIDFVKAKLFAKSLGPKARAIEVDVRSDQSLAAALRACDIVVSTVGPTICSVPVYCPRRLMPVFTISISVTTRSQRWRCCRWTIRRRQRGSPRLSAQGRVRGLPICWRRKRCSYCHRQRRFIPSGEVVAPCATMKGPSSEAVPPGRRRPRYTGSSRYQDRSRYTGVVVSARLSLCKRLSWNFRAEALIAAISWATRNPSLSRGLTPVSNNPIT
ncbi:hypothetical protein GNX18_02065 [Microbulbifer sp. SH-1]|nr:hypothetical protein GNX18_02065 [Microbulbifer sp. SH-1]